MREFRHILVNTMLANITTSGLWFALTFWLYLETRSVLVTAITGGAYMLLVAVMAIPFGTFVDHNRKKRAMVLASIAPLVGFSLGGIIFSTVPRELLVDWRGPWFWVFCVVILAGAVGENLRNIALATCVTLLVPQDRHANANGLVGAVGGVGFIVTSVFAGLAVGFFGMGWTLVAAIGLSVVTLLHLVFVKIPEARIVADPTRSRFDLQGSLAAIRSVPGLFALVLFATFNNLLGGVYMALMDPYGLTLFSVQTWGIVLGITATGFIAGGLLVAKFGLGRQPIRTLLMVLIAMGFVGAVFTIREWAWLYIAGITAYLILVPVTEAAEQTVIQRVVPLQRQGRVFGFAQALELGAAPITSFLIGPIAEFAIIPWMRSDAGRASLGWLLGGGEARGIALIFLVAGLILMLAAALAFLSPAYRHLSAVFEAEAVEPDPAAA